MRPRQSARLSAPQAGLHAGMAPAAPATVVLHQWGRQLTPRYLPCPPHVGEGRNGPRSDIKHDPTRLRGRCLASSSCKSIGSAHKVRKHAHKLFGFDWFIQTRRPLERRTVELPFAIAGNNYIGYLSRDQGVDKISRQLTIQIERIDSSSTIRMRPPCKPEENCNFAMLEPRYAVGKATSQINPSGA